MIAIIIGIYLIVGISLVAFGPAKQNISNEIQKTHGSPLVNALKGRATVPESKMILLRVMLSLGFVLLWPVMLSGVLKENAGTYNEQKPKELPDLEGLRFQLMGGYGTVSCGKCEFSEKLTSFTHGRRSSNTGYQCQTCGKFASRGYRQPFIDSDDSDYDKSILELPPEERPSRIEHLQSMIRLCEGQMEKTPKGEWLPTWEPTVTKNRQELSAVSEEELAQIKGIRDQVDAAYKASLFCECGGILDREQVLFCPRCRSTKLSYKMKYIT